MKKLSMEEFIKWYESIPGEQSKRSAAKHFGVSSQTLMSYLDLWKINAPKIGYIRKNPDRPMPEKKEMIEWIKNQPNGVTYTDIANHYDTDDRTIRLWFNTWKINAVKAGYVVGKDYKKPTKEEFIAYLKTQKTSINMKDISDHYNINIPTIASWLHSWDTSLMALGYGSRGNANINKNKKPTLDEFITWVDTQPRNLKRKDIANHYNVTINNVYIWMKNWGISMADMGVGQYRIDTTLPQTIDEMKDWLKDKPKNITQNEIADAFGIDRGKLNRLFKKWGTTLTKEGYGTYNQTQKKPSKYEFLKWLESQPKDITQKKISEHYNVNESAIESWVASWGFKLRDLGYGKFAKKIEKSEFLSWWDAQDDQKRITLKIAAKHFNVSPSGLKKWMTSWGTSLPELKGDYIKHFYHKGYTFMMKPNKLYTSMVLPSDFPNYIDIIILEYNRENTLIYVVDVDGNEYIKKPSDLINEYIERKENGDDKI